MITKITLIIINQSKLTEGEGEAERRRRRRKKKKVNQINLTNRASAAAERVTAHRVEATVPKVFVFKLHLIFLDHLNTELKKSF